MNPPTNAEIDAALAALGRGALPAGELSPGLRRVGLIGRAKDAGASWAQIGEALGGVDGRLAKRYANRLASAVNRDLVAKGVDGA